MSQILVVFQDLDHCWSQHGAPGRYRRVAAASVQAVLQSTHLEYVTRVRYSDTCQCTLGYQSRTVRAV